MTKKRNKSFLGTIVDWWTIKCFKQSAVVGILLSTAIGYGLLKGETKIDF